MGRCLYGILRDALTVPAPVLQPRGWDTGHGSAWCRAEPSLSTEPFVHRTIFAPRPSTSGPTLACLASCRGKNKGSLVSATIHCQDQGKANLSFPPPTSLYQPPGCPPPTRPGPREPTHPTMPSVWLKPSLGPCLHPTAPRPRPSFLSAERSPFPAPWRPFLSCLPHSSVLPHGQCWDSLRVASCHPWEVLRPQRVL